MESRKLKEFREFWVGMPVEFFGQRGTVNGVGDDGARCVHDARRRPKPTGMLFIKRNDGVMLDIPYFNVKITPPPTDNRK